MDSLFGYCISGTVPVRITDSDASEMDTQLLLGECFEVLAITERWVQVRTIYDKVEGWVNYDKSEFGSQSALYNSDEEKLEEVYAKVHSLADFTKAENYKSYAELKAKLYRVLALDEEASTPATAEQDNEFDLSSMGNATAAAPQPTLTEAMPAPTSTSLSMDDDDDDLSIFKELANG